MHTKVYHRKATDHYFPQVLGSKFVFVLGDCFPSSLFPGVKSSKPNMRSQGGIFRALMFAGCLSVTTLQARGTLSHADNRLRKTAGRERLSPNA